MTTRRATDRRTTLEKRHDLVVADLLDGMKPSQVAEKYKVARSSVAKFIQRHAEEITTKTAEIDRQVTDYAIASKVQRIAALNDRWQRGHQVIAERAKDLADVAGGGTGLLVRQYKSIGAGDNAQLVEEYKVDTALLAELRATERAAAEELAQITGLPKGDTYHIDKAVLVRYIEGPSQMEIG